MLKISLGKLSAQGNELLAQSLKYVDYADTVISPGHFYWLWAESLTIFKKLVWYWIFKQCRKIRCRSVDPKTECCARLFNQSGKFKGYIYSSCHYHHQIGSIHLSHCFHIFQWLCAWDVCDIIFCHLLYIHSGKTGNLFSLVLCSLWWVQIVGYVLACRSYSFVCTLHHLIIIIVQTLSEDIELIECLSDIICRVCE